MAGCEVDMSDVGVDDRLKLKKDWADAKLGNWRNRGLRGGAGDSDGVVSAEESIGERGRWTFC